MAAALAGPGGITENQAKHIRFETTQTGYGVLMSRCKACGHWLLSDSVAGEGRTHHNRIKAEHRDRHYWGLFPNDRVKEAS